MARRRNRTVEETPIEVTPTERKGTMSVESLDAAAIQELLASSRQRGTYDAELRAFVDSGEAGVKVNLDSGTFAGKKAQSVKTGFESARKREGAPAESENVRVILQEDNVYLIRGDMQ